MSINFNDLLSLAKGDPQSTYEKMMRENPQFKDFVEKNKGRNPDDIAKDYNIDSALMKLFIR